MCKKDRPIVSMVQAIDANDVPFKLFGACLDVDDEFPLHCGTGIVQMFDDGNPVSEWLKSIGFKFSGDDFTNLAVWGT